MSPSRPYLVVKVLSGLVAVCGLALPLASQADDAGDVPARLEAAKRLPVPLPNKTPFDGDPKARKVYLEEYCAGYRTVLAAVIVDCHMGVKGPYFEAFQRGWEDGKNAAVKTHPEKAAEILGIPWDQYKKFIKEPATTTPRPQ